MFVKLLWHCYLFPCDLFRIYLLISFHFILFLFMFVVALWLFFTHFLFFFFFFLYLYSTPASNSLIRLAWVLSSFFFFFFESRSCFSFSFFDFCCLFLCLTKERGEIGNVWLHKDVCFSPSRNLYKCGSGIYNNVCSSIVIDWVGGEGLDYRTKMNKSFVTLL